VNVSLRCEYNLRFVNDYTINCSDLQVTVEQSSRIGEAVSPHAIWLILKLNKSEERRKIDTCFYPTATCSDHSCILMMTTNKNIYGHLSLTCENKSKSRDTQGKKSVRVSALTC
jgi:hypothetical protein